MSLALCLGLAAPAAAQAPAVSASAKAPKIDRDGDRVLDELEQRLATRVADAPVDVIVTLDRPASVSRVNRLERGVGDIAVRRRFQLLDGFAARVSKAQVARLSRRPGVASVQSDGRVRALNASGSSAFGVTKARLDLPYLDGDRDGNPARYTPRDMVAAVLDTGIDARHRDLDEGKVLAFADCASGRCRLRGPYDNDGHGTHVSGTLAGEGDARAGRPERGVAPAAGLVGVKVLGSDGSGAESAVIAGMEWAKANRSRYGIEALNLSLGGAGCSDGTDAMSRAANRASAAGLVVVAAAGNDGPARCTINAPAAAADVLAVGSMADTANGGFFPSWTSGRGQLGRRVKPDVMAPGIGVVSARAATTAGYTRRNGTSSASPFVTGVALLMLDANPTRAPSGIRDRIRSTAIDWGVPGADIDFGSGRLDAYAALRSAGGGTRALTSPPQSPAHRVFQGSFITGEKKACSYPLEVADTRRPIAASLIVSRWRASSPASVDFDLQLRDPDNQPVARDESIERQNDITYRPTRIGRYTLKVIQADGSEGGDFVADVSAGLSSEPSSEPVTCS